MAKKKELSDKDLKKATGGASARGETGGTTHPGQHGPRGGYVGGKPIHDAGNVNIKPKNPHIRRV